VAFRPKAFTILYKPPVGRTKLAPPSFRKNPARGWRSGVAKKLDEPVYIAPARLSFYPLFMVTPYLYSVPISIMPGRIFSTLSFCIYSVVYSNGEFKKYFATPLRHPLAGLFWLL
jgi:hypothetical protein